MIFYKPHFFSSEIQRFHITPGKSLYDSLYPLSVPINHRPYMVVRVNGREVLSEDWKKVFLSQEDVIEVQLLPMGGSDEKNPLAFIAQIALLASTGSIVANWGLKGAEAALANAALTVGGTLLINSVFPPPTVNRDTRRDPKESQNYTAQASRNEIDPYGPQLSVFGKTLLRPKYAAAPYTLSVGDVQYLYMLFDLGYGKVEPSELKFGERTMLSAYEEVEYKLHQEFEAGDTLEFFTNDVFTEDFALNVLKDSPRTVTTIEGTDEAIINLTWARGLTRYDDRGKRGFHSVNFQVEWKLSTDQNFSSLSNARGFSTTSSAVNAWNRKSGFIIADSSPWDRHDQARRLHHGISYHSTPVAGDTVLEIYSSVPIEAGVDKLKDFTRNKSYGITKVKSYPNSTRMDITIDAPLIYFSTEMKIEHNKAVSIPLGTQSVKVVSEEFLPVDGDFLFISGVKYTLQNVEVIAENGWGDGGAFTADLDRPLEFDIDGISDFGYDSKFTGLYLRGADCLLQSQNEVGLDFGILRKTAEPFSVGVIIKFDTPGQYDIRVTRITEDADDDRTLDEFSVTTLQSLKYQVPVKPRVPRTFIEMKIKVNEQLNGPIDDFNCIASRYLPVDDGQGNFSLQETSLVPWIIREILTGNLAPKPMKSTSIHEQSFRDCEAWCKQLNADGEYKFQCDFVFDWDTTIRELVQQVASTARCSVIQVDGKFKIVIDKEKPVRTQVFTSRNISRYSSGRFIPDRPDYVRATFTDKEAGYIPQTGNVFDDGKTLENSSVFESQEHFGTLRWRQAWENTRWMMAMGVHRSKFHKFVVDIEGIVAIKGDRVGFQHELPRQGGLPSRIETLVQNVVSGQVETIIGIDRDVVDGGFDEYSMLFRTSKGTIFVIAGVELAPEEGPNKIKMPSYTQGDPNPYVDVDAGDLVVYGETDKTIVDCLVDSIEPIDDLGSEIKLVSYAPEVLTADSADIGPYEYSQSRSDLFGAPPGVVRHLKAHQSIDYKDRFPVISIWLSWLAANAGAYAYQFEIYYQGPEDYEKIVLGVPEPFNPKLIGTSFDPRFRFLDSTRQDQLDIFGKKLFFWVVAVSKQGSKLPVRSSQRITIVPEKDSIGPGSPKNLKAEVVNGNLFLIWTVPADVDLSHFTIKRGRISGDTWEGAQVINQASYPDNLGTNIMKSLIENPLNGTYYVGALDTSGNQGGVSSVQFLGIPPSILDADARIVDRGIEVSIDALPGDFPIKEYRVYSGTSNPVLLGKSTTSTVFIPVTGMSNLKLTIHAISIREETAILSGKEFDFITGEEWVPATQAMLDEPLTTGTLTNATEVSVVGKVSTFSVLDNPVRTWDEVFDGGKTLDEFYQEGNLEMTKVGAYSEIHLRRIWFSGTGRLEGIAVLDIDTSNMPQGVAIEVYMLGYEHSVIISGNPAYTQYLKPTKYPMSPLDTQNGIEWYGQFRKALAIDFIIKVIHTGESPGNTFNIDVSISSLKFSSTIRSGKVSCDSADVNGTLVSQNDIGIYFVNPASNTVDISDPILTPIGISGAYTEIPLWDGAGFFVKLYDSQGNRISGDVSWSIQGVFNSNT